MIKQVLLSVNDLTCARVLVFIVFVLGSLVSGCSDNPNALNKIEVQDIAVTDSSGQLVTLDQPAQRIVALAPHAVENVFAVGAGDKLIGVSEYSDYPEQATRLPVVSGFNSINIEAILDLNPDLVIAWESGNSPSAIDRLKELGLSVYLDQPKSLSDIAQSMRNIGKLAGTLEQANKTAQEFELNLEGLRNAHATKEQVLVFYQVWNSPLQTINGDHIISSAIELCGGSNIYAGEYAVAPVVSIESVLQRNPQAIIASGVGDNRPEWLDDWLDWPELAATQNNGLFVVNPDHIQRHTTRILFGISKICSQLEQVRAFSLAKNNKDTR